MVMGSQEVLERITMSKANIIFRLVKRAIRIVRSLWIIRIVHFYKFVFSYWQTLHQILPASTPWIFSITSLTTYRFPWIQMAPKWSNLFKQTLSTNTSASKGERMEMNSWTSLMDVYKVAQDGWSFWLPCLTEFQGTGCLWWRTSLEFNQRENNGNVKAIMKEEQ